MAVEDTVLWHFYIEFEGFTSQHVRLWQSQRDEVYLVQKKTEYGLQIEFERNSLLFRTKRENILLAGFRLQCSFVAYRI